MRFLETSAGKAFLSAERERLRYDKPKVSHGLDAPLILTLTSYPPRYQYLHLTLNSLLNQSVVPDEVILWIAERDIDALPDVVKAMHQSISIRTCEDIGPYKKLIPSILAYPGCYIAQADDDLYYHHRWLDELLVLNSGKGDVTTCHFGFRFSTADEYPISYQYWEPNCCGTDGPSNNIVPIGAGGILYPPYSFDREVTNCCLFMNIAPLSDDLWFYVMARIQGFLPVTTKNQFEIIPWPGTQDVGLWCTDAIHRNNAAIKKLCERYGTNIFMAE